MNKRAIIYARTAYKDRGSDWSQIKKQLQACSKLAKKSGLIMVDTVLHEGVSGLDNAEKRLLNLLALCKEKRVKNLITYDIEYLSRDYTNCIRFLFLLKNQKHRFINSCSRRRLG